MHRRSALPLIAAIVLFGAGYTPDSSALAAQADSSVLSRMDREAASFRNMTANVSTATFTAVLNDTTRESGRITMMRTPKGVAMRTDVTGQDQRSVAVQGGTAEFYYPKIRTVNVYELGKNASLVDQFLLVGWGSSVKDLRRNYGVRVAGQETLEGKKATRVELTPKSAKALEQITKVEIWIPEDAGHPVQQKFHQPGGDYYLVNFSDIKLNGNIPAEAVRLELPKNVKREYPSR